MSCEPCEDLSTAPPPDDRGEYDLIVIGGGSGGIACALAAKSYGAKVALLDFVTPSPFGSKWGIGGTCANVGCIPKKLFHLAALIGEGMEDAGAYGWKQRAGKIEIDWKILVEKVSNHIKSTTWLASVSLRTAHVDYINAKGAFLDPHTIEGVTKDFNKVRLKGKHIVLATGGRPKYLEVPGSDLAITSDDIFSLEEPPGKTIIIGAGYVALECAGFLNGLQFPVKLLVRGQVLRGFDEQMAELIACDLADRGVVIERKSNLTGIKKLPDGKLEVSYKSEKGLNQECCDTVLMAVGRTPSSAALNLSAAGVKVDPLTLKIPAINEQTNVPHIYVVGDLLHGTPELTPVATKAGKLLAGRLFGKSDVMMEYKNVPTTLFTPLEYGFVGMTEEKAIKLHGEDKIEVYHAFYKPYEFSIPQKSMARCYIKVIADRASGLIYGIHYLGPNAGEIIQGYAVAVRCKVTIEKLTSTIGVHPTLSQEFTRLYITKRSNTDPSPQLCCS